MAELVILVGLPAAGKSSLCRERFAATHVLVSKDLMGRRRDKQAHQLALVGEALAAGRSVAVDNVNATPRDRAPLIALARAHGARAVAYYFETAPADAVARNRGRTGAARVPDVAIYVAARRLQAPSLAEGFDALFRVRLRADGEFDVTEAADPGAAG